MAEASVSPYDRLLSGFDDLVSRVMHLEERLMVAEGAWMRHGREMDRQREDIRECQHLHCGCGERLVSEDAAKRAWVGDPCIAYELEDDE